MKKYLIVIDMQKDFVDGALGTKEAEAIVPAVLDKVNSFDGEVIFTKDTHFEDYLTTSEGAMLPVEHCIKGTEGWQLIPPLEKYCTANKNKDFNSAFNFISTIFFGQVLQRLYYKENSTIY